MIKSSEFTKEGAALRVDEQTRINHVSCPAGTDTRGRLYIKRKDHDTLLAYCHNCGDYGIHSNRGRTRAIKELLNEAIHDERNGAGELVLPPDACYSSWPIQAISWLSKYGIHDNEIGDAGICYSPSWNRLILPVYEDGKLVYWQGRALAPGQNPKYVSAKAHPKVMYWHVPRGIVPLECTYSIFIVEDMLSAIKLGRYVDTVALLGTSPDIDGLTKRLENYNKVGIFLDPDLAGITKSRELHARLSLAFAGDVSRIESIKQPKEMSNAELEAVAIGLRSSPSH